MNVGVSQRAWNAVRGADWWAYKIPPLLTVGFAGMLQFGEGPAAWIRVAAATGAIVFVAAYGYVLNDVCDVAADRAGGRPNRMAAVGTTGRIASVLVPATAALWLAWATDVPVILLLVCANLILPTVYSVPPVRLKGRGVWGAVADAAGAHAVPTATVAWAATVPSGSDDAARGAFVAAAVSWALFTGLRGILVHQIADRDVDARAGVMTLGRRLGPARARRLVLAGLFPAELVSLACFVGPTLGGAPAAAGLAGMGVGLDLWRRFRGWTQPLFAPPATSRERFIPLLSNELYEIWLPVGLATALAVRWPMLAWLPVLLVGLFWRNIRTRLSDVPALIGRPVGA